MLSFCVLICNCVVMNSNLMFGWCCAHTYHGVTKMAYSHTYIQVMIEANNMKIKCPNQLFINGEFVNSSGGQSYDTINPADESVRAFVVFSACSYPVLSCLPL